MKKMLMSVISFVLMANVSFAGGFTDRLSVSVGGLAGALGDMPNTAMGLNVQASVAMTSWVDAELSYTHMSAANMEKYTTDTYIAGLFRQIKMDRSRALMADCYLASMRIGPRYNGFHPYLTGGGGLMSVTDRRTDAYNPSGTYTSSTSQFVVRGGLGFIADLSKSLAFQLEGSYLSGPSAARLLNAGLVYRL